MKELEEDDSRGMSAVILDERDKEFVRQNIIGAILDQVEHKLIKK